VPDDAWADHFGTLAISTAAWFEEGKLDVSFKRGKSMELRGWLYGLEETRAEPEDARPIRRSVNAVWAPGQRPVWTYSREQEEMGEEVAVEQAFGKEGAYVSWRAPAAGSRTSVVM
jgi:hypothetical protein